MNEITYDAIARVAHEANRAYCTAIGDDSQVAWEAAPEWQRTSALNGVKYHVEHPGARPEDSHDNWLAEKEAEGWKHGEVKDVNAKTHPAFLPYWELPIEQRIKDALFIAVVKTLLKAEADRQMEAGAEQLA